MPGTHRARHSICHRIGELSRRAERDRAAFEAPVDPPASDEAMRYLREGAGPAVWLYIEARTDGFDHIPPARFRELENAMNAWFELYAACHGVDTTAEFTVRTAAELLLETHNIRDTAAALTHVPDDR